MSETNTLIMTERSIDAADEPISLGSSWRHQDDCTQEEKLVALLQDALEAIDDMLECTPQDLEEYGRAVALEERLRISGEMELLGYDGFFSRD